jgi:hypothetical protein
VLPDGMEESEVIKTFANRDYRTEEVNLTLLF